MVNVKTRVLIGFKSLGLKSMGLLLMLSMAACSRTADFNKMPGTDKDTGTVTAAAKLEWSSKDVVFPSTNINAESSIVLSLKNSGTGPSKAIVLDWLTADTTIVVDTNNNSCTGRVLESKESCSVKILYRPTTAGSSMNLLKGHDLIREDQVLFRGVAIDPGAGVSLLDPVAFDNTLNVIEDVVANGILTAMDYNNDSLVYEVVAQGAKGSVNITNTSTGMFTYSPNSNLTGADSFTFKVTNTTLKISNTATISVNIAPMNDAPIANNSSFNTNEDSAYVGAMSAVDTESSPLTYTILTMPTKGVISSVDTSTGSFTYTPNANETGSDSFTFKVNDGSLDSNVATVSINIDAMNDAPIANAQSIVVVEDTPYSGTLTGSDTESVITYSVVAQGSKGVVTITNPSTGAFTYTPNANATGADSFSFKVNDGSTDSATATVSVTITPVNDAPISNDDSIVTDEDVAYSGNLVAVDVESAPLNYTVVSQGTKGTVTITNSVTGAFTYTPNANTTGADSFTFKANDGTLDSNVATISVTINPLNDLPLADDQSITVIEDTMYSGTLTGSDTESAITFAVATQGSKGIVTITNATTGAFTYTPNSNETGTDSFTFKTNDGTSDSLDATVTVNITPVNDIPVATSATINVDEETVYSGTLMGSDVEASPLVFSVVAQGSKGTVTITNAATGSFTYTPNLNATGADAFVFKVNDGTNDSVDALVTVNIQNLNDAPVSNNQSLTVVEDTPENGALISTDGDGNSLTYSVVAQGTKGTVTITNASTGSFTYTPNSNETGADSFTFKTNDGTTDSNVATVSVSITPVNDAPTADDLNRLTLKNTPVTTTLNGGDVDGDTITYTIVSSPTNGVLSGTLPNLTYTPNNNYFGSDSFTFKVNDGTLDSNVATVSLTVSNTNTAPVSTGMGLAVVEDTVKSETLLSTDSDGDILTYSVVAQGTKGTVTITNATTGAFTYTPNLNANGADSFTFKANDGALDSNVSTVTVTISAVNDTPIADNGSFTTNEDTIHNGSLVASDVDGDGLTYSVVAQGSKGVVVITNSSTGAFTYTPNANATGSDSFTFQVNDGTVNSNTATVAVTISSANDAPIAFADTVSTNEDTALPIILTGYDEEGSALTYTIVSSPTKGVISGTLPNLTYTPNLNATGADSFTFKVNDGTTDSNIATVAITINSVNDIPVADNSSFTTNEDTAHNGTLTGSDLDANPLTYSVVAQGTKGTVTITNSSTGAFTYTPNLNATGSDSFTFRVNDGTANSSAATVSVTITPVNDAPIANNESITPTEDTVFNGTLVATDVDGDSLTYSVVAQGSKGVVVITNSSTGAFTYTPNLNATGADSFTFRVNDGTVNSNTATVSVTISSANDLPVANNNSFTTNEDTAHNGTLVATDLDGDSLTYSVVAQGTKGTVTITNSSTGAFTYTPNLNATGSDSFTFRVNDGTGNSNIATISVTITPVNDTPIANNTSFTTNEETVHSGTLSATDVDGDALTYSVVAQGTKGVVSITNATTGAFTYTPNANAIGADSFTFRVNDGTVNSNTATVLVTITPVNDAPIANAQSVSVNEDSSLGITLTGSDADGDILTYSIVSGPTSGSLTGSGDSRTYTPNANYNGADSFTFRVNDGTVNSSTVTVTITVTPINDAPIANNQSITPTEDTVFSGTLVGTDVDGNALTYSVVAQGTKGVVLITNATTGAFTYTPNANATGSDSFTFRVNDGTVNSNTATVSVTISNTNDLPVANNNSFTTNEDTAYNGTLVATDADSNPLTYSVIAQGTKGTVVITNTSTGAFTYTPNLNANGADSFTFKANDGTGNSNTATISVTITPVNDTPVATGGSVSTNKNVPVGVTLTASDIDGDTLNYIIVTGPLHGTITGSGSSRTYTPVTNYAGADSFTFKVNDGTIDSNTVTVNITVINPNQAPTANGQTVTALVRDSSSSITLTGTDPESDPLTYTIVTNPSSGTLSGTGSNRTYTPSAWTSCGAEGGTCSFTGTKLVKYGSASKFVVRVATSSIGCNNDNFSDPDPGAGKTCSHRPLSDSFTFKVNDGSLDSTNATVTINFTDWYNTAWTKRKKIVFNAPITADVLDAPILVRLDSSRIDYSNTQNSGQDLRFIGSGGEVLSHEIETWNESGISYVWVKVSIGAAETKNKHIWMYYGNASASDGQNKTSVWSNGYSAVWHMNQTSGTVLDSTSNNNHGTVNGTLTRNTAGPLGNSYTSSSSGACFSIPHNSSQAIESTLTMETWAKVVSGGTARYFVQKDVQYSSNWYNAYAFGATSSSTKLFTKATDDGGNNTIGSEDTLIATNTSLTSGQWQYHVAVYDGDLNNSSKSIKLFTDGQLLQHQTNYSGSLYAGTNWQYLNIMGDCSANGFLGSMDEVRISNVLRSDDWVKVQYLSMTDNLVMYSNEQTISTATNPFSYVLKIAANLDDGNIFRHDSSLHQSGFNSSGKSWMGETNQQASWGYHRFILPVAIPSGTSLYNSKLKLKGAYDAAQIWNNASNYLKVYAQKSSNSAQITAANQYPGGAGGITSTTASANWNSSSLTWDSYDVNLSPSLNSPINEVISTYGGLSSGSAIQLWSVRGAVFNCASWCEVGAKDYAGGALDAGQLLIEW